MRILRLTIRQIHGIICLLRGPLGGWRQERLRQPGLWPSLHHRGHCQGPEREEGRIPQDRDMSKRGRQFARSCA